MNRETKAGLGRLNAYQIAGLSMVTSTAAALCTLAALRRWVFRPAPAGKSSAAAVGGDHRFGATGREQIDR